MAGFPNPVHSILQGILTGYSVANQIRRAAVEEEERRRKAELEDLEARIRLSQVGRPVLAGTVTELDPESGATVVRPARKGTLKYTDRLGETLEVEPYLPEELEQRKALLRAKTEREVEEAKTEGQYKGRMKALEIFGVNLPKEVLQMTGLPEGTKVFPTELDQIMRAAGEIAKFQAEANKKSPDDPVKQAFILTDDNGNATVVSVRNSGKVEKQTIPRAGRSAKSEISPAEQRLREKDLREQTAKKIAGEILWRVGFDPEKAKSYLQSFFIDRPDLADYRSDVYEILHKYASKDASMADLMMLLMRNQQGGAPATPGSAPISKEAAEYLKKKGL